MICRDISNTAEAEDLELPWQEEVFGGGFVSGDAFEDGAGAEEGGVESEVVADFVAMGFEGVEAAFGVWVSLGAAAGWAARPVGFGEFVGAFECVVEAAVEGRWVAVREAGFAAVLEAFCEGEEFLIADDLEGGAVEAFGFEVTPVPEGAEEVEAYGAEVAAAVDAPEFVWVWRWAVEDGESGVFAGLEEPVGAAEFGEFGEEFVGERDDEVDVVEGVFDHAVGEGTAAPVGALGLFGEDDAEIGFDEVSEAELAFAAEASGDLGVEDSDGDVLERSAHEGHVEVSAVEPDVGTVEVGDEGGEVFDADGVDEDLAVADAHLDEAEFFAVGVEGIGLGVEGDADAIA